MIAIQFLHVQYDSSNRFLFNYVCGRNKIGLSVEVRWIAEFRINNELRMHDFMSFNCIFTRFISLCTCILFAYVDESATTSVKD